MVKVFFTYDLLKQSRVKYLIKYLSETYDCDLEKLRSYSFYTNPKGKVFISNFRADTIDLDRVNSVGLYFGTFHDEERFRLSIEGSKFIKAKKNYLILNKESIKSYIAAEDLNMGDFKPVNIDNSASFIIARFEDENLGCVSIKDNKALSYVPKSRKLDIDKLF